MAKKGHDIKPLNENEYTDFEEIGFSNGDGLSEDIFSLNDENPTYDNAPIKMFSFNESESNRTIFNSNIPNNTEQIPLNENLNPLDNSTIKSSKPTTQSITPNSKIRGLTPAIDGESFSIKRCYQFRPSTLKKLNQLKGESDNFNIYLNEIIDAAICFYHNSIFNKK